MIEINQFSTRLKAVFFALLCLLIFLSPALTEPVLSERIPEVFSTWEGFEVDKCASIWLIKRYINNNAEIRFFPKGSQIQEGVAFDTPYAKFRRYHNASTYETLIRHYKITDPKAVYIGRIIHDIEINVWERKVMPETRSVQVAINGIIMTAEQNHEVIGKSAKFFDSLLSEIQVKN